MRLKTFLVLVIGLVVIGATAVGLTRCSREESPSVPSSPPVAVVPPERPAPPTRTPADTVPTPPRPAATPTEPARAISQPVPPPRPVAVPEYELMILARVGQDLGTAKSKDIFPRRTYKISLYQDDGFRTVNRAKVDLDRDDKWDEKWTFEEGRISKQVAPADDENYTRTFVRENGVWVQD